jgi:hypothetical protein
MDREFPFNRRSSDHGEELREVARSRGLAFEAGKVKTPRELRPGVPDGRGEPEESDQ